jgi:hypothetical protein
MKSFLFVLTWLEVSLAFFTSFEALFVVFCDLSRPKPQSLHQDSTSAPVFFSTFSSVSLAGFVKVLRSDFCKSRSTLHQWIQPSTRHCTTNTVAPASRFHLPMHHLPFTRRRVVLTLRSASTRILPLSCLLLQQQVFGFFSCYYVYYLGYCTEIWCASFTLDPFHLALLPLQQPPSRGCRYLAGFWVVLKYPFFLFWC